MYIQCIYDVNTIRTTQFIMVSIVIWLVVEPYPSEKDWSSSIWMMTFPTEWKFIKFMFQTTNQIICFWLNYTYSTELWLFGDHFPY